MNIACKRLMMPLRKLFLGSVIILLLISGVVTVDDWGVFYTPTYICAVKGSTVTMSCRYTHPSYHRVQKVFWSTELLTKVRVPPDLASDPAYKNRIQYISDKENDCTLRLKNVSKLDQRRYYVNFLIEQPSVVYQGIVGVLLSVTELRVEVPENVVDGTAVILTCNTTCTLTDQTFIWYKNGQKLNRNTRILYLVSVSREKAESYSCAVGDLQSPAVTLNVQYPPERVSVSISPSVEKVEGSSVTLTCITDANPPVMDNEYTWFKTETDGTTSFKGAGRIYTIKEARSEDSGEYFCRATNKHGSQRSITVNLNVLFSVSISPSDEIMEGSSVTLTCSTDANPPVTDAKYIWFKRKTDGTPSITETERIYTIKKISSEDRGEYYCKAANKHGSQYSITVNLNVLYPPKSFSVSISPSDEILEGSSVTLTCSADANPPVQDCKLYKGNSFKGDGSIHTMSSVSSEDSGDYKCKCSYKSQEKYSAAVTLTVLYPPKTVRVSISPSGEKVEGSLKTLTCSSDANPPVQSYSWFKEGGDSPVGSGQSYNVLQAGSYYCVAQNKYGNQTAAALSVTSNDILGDNSAVLYAVLGVVAVCLIAITVGLVIWARRRGRSAGDAKPNQENVYSNVETRPSTNIQTSDHDEFEYASVLNQAPKKPRKVKSSPVKASGSGSTDEFLYATVPPYGERGAGKPQEDDPQYSSIMFTRSGAASRSAALRAEDCSVIYSSVK